MEFGFIFVIMACVLANTLAIDNDNSKVEKAHSDVMSYAKEQMANVPKIMARTSFHLECYNGFLPLINSLAIRARDVSNGCVVIANFERDQEMEELKKNRLTVDAEVKKVSTSLRQCTRLSGLDYFWCLGNNAEINKKIMQIVKVKSKEFASKYGMNLKTIDDREQKCILKAVENAKAETDQNFVELKSCIQHGPVIETQIDEESTT